MKKLLFLFSFLLPLSMAAQSDITTDLVYRGHSDVILRLSPVDTVGSVSSFTHIILYRGSTTLWVQNGDFSSPTKKEHVMCEVFSSEAAALDWLNTPNYYFVGDDRRVTRLNENELIGIFDMRTAKKIEVSFKTEKKSIPEKVVVKAREWEDTYFEKKN